MQPEKITNWNDLEELRPTHALVAGVDLVIVRYGQEVSVMYGRCLHRGALLADGFISGDNLVCGIHNWDYRYDTGVSEYHNDQYLERFRAWVEDGGLWVDADEIAAFANAHPQPFDRKRISGCLPGSARDARRASCGRHSRTCSPRTLAHRSSWARRCHGGSAREPYLRGMTSSSVTAQLARPPSSTMSRLARAWSSVQRRNARSTSRSRSSSPT